jgi:DNA-directed RNA polymerase specialized sigma24 family protein
VSTLLSTSRVGYCAGRTNAEDVAQEAVPRACRFFRSFRGGNASAWLLQIVRNTGEESSLELSMEFDEELNLQTRATPEILAIACDDRRPLIMALETLPSHFREVLVLRELEKLFLQADRRHHVDSHRHVLALPCPPPVVFRAGKFL